MIDTRAIIDPSARLAANVSVGPWTIIGPGVEIGEGTQVASHVVIRSNTRIGANNRIFQFASIGEDPADKKFAGEETWLEIGSDNIIREGVGLVWRSSQGLMDKRVERTVLATIDQTLEQFRHPAIRFDHLSSRRSGTRRFVHLHMHLPADWTLRRAAALRTSVEQALMSDVPGLRATIELLPSDVESHTHDIEDLI